jgi:hypothetical protein
MELGGRKISVSLYIVAFVITAAIFCAGLYIGQVMERDNMNSISASLDGLNTRMSSAEIFFLSGDSPQFCPVYLDELSNIDSETENTGYMLEYMENVRGVADPGLKRKYFLLEAKAYLLSQKSVAECGANFTTVLYFYSNSNCSRCQEQGNGLMEMKKALGESVRIYSFDGDLGSPIAKALMNMYNVSVYPSVVVAGNATHSGFVSHEDLQNIMNRTW